MLAEEFGISRLKVRKILITTGEVVYPETKRIQELLAAGGKQEMRIHRSSFDDALKNVFDYRKKGEDIGGDSLDERCKIGLPIKLT